MNATRRNFILGAAAAATSGCRFAPPGRGDDIGRGIGAATGLVMDPYVTEAETRAAVVATVGDIGRLTPRDGETVADAMMRIAKARVGDLVKAGELTEAQGALVMAAFNLVLKGWALVVSRCPQAGAWCEFTAAAVGGFCEGFLAVFRPSNGETDASADVRAFRALRESTECVRLRNAAFGRMRRPRE